MLVIILILISKNCREHQIATEIDSLNFNNVFLEQQNLKKDLLIKESELIIEDLASRGFDLERENSYLRVQIALTDSRRQTISSRVDTTPADTIYRVLCETYKDTSEKRFPFGSGQIKSIYITKLDHDILLESDSLLRKQVFVKDIQLELKDSIIAQKDTIISVYKERVKIREAVISNNRQIIDLLEEEVHKHQRNELYWKIGAVGIAVLAVIVII